MIYEIGFINRDELSHEIGHLGLLMDNGEKRIVCYTVDEDDIEVYPVDNNPTDLSDDDYNDIFNFLLDYFNGNLEEINDEYVEVEDTSTDLTKEEIEQIVAEVRDSLT